MPAVSRQINEVVKIGEVKHVLLTGHSAGGAVASLMFAKYLSHAAADCKPDHPESFHKHVADKLFP